MKKYYIAYGSNLNFHQMKRRCPYAYFVGKTTLKGYELVFKISKTGAYLTIQPSKTGEVPVAIWRVTEADEERLDCYEGYPTYYEKKEFELQYKGTLTGLKRTVTAFAYIMRSDRPVGVPSSLYFATCLLGYDMLNFDRNLLYEARERSMQLVTHKSDICPYCGNIID